MSQIEVCNDYDSRMSYSLVNDEEASKKQSTSFSRVLIVAGILISVTLALTAIDILDLALPYRLPLHAHHGTELVSLSPSQLAGKPDRFRLDWDQSASPQTRQYDFVLTEALGAPAGVYKKMLLVNGQFPGPVIEANVGDRLVVRVQNSLARSSSIHWHGQLQNQTNYMDGSSYITQCPIPPGQSFTYDFVLQNSGTSWWHAHHGASYMDGLVGPMIIHERPGAEIAGGVDEELVVMMSDLYNRGSDELLPFYLGNLDDSTRGDEPVPDSGTINGVGRTRGVGSYHEFNLEPNQR